jgi:tetratricopeptide (TPR) repeat protein
MRNTLRTVSILFVILAAIYVPIVISGYSELDKAAGSTSYLEAAKHHQTAARRLFWRADLYERAGHEYYYAKEYVLAEAMYQKTFQRHSLSPDGWVAWGDVIYLMGDPERAAQIWKQALEQPGYSEKLYSRLAQTYKESKDYVEAAHYLQLYVSNHLDDASARYRLGLLLTLSDPKLAAQELSAASQLDLNLDPASQTLRTALNLASLSESPSEQKTIIGRGLGLVYEWELARTAFEQAVQLNADNAEAWAWLAEADQQSAGEETLDQVRSDAIVKLVRAASLNPNSAVVHVLRGLYFQRVGNHYEALAEFQTAAKLNPDDPTLYVSIAESFTNLGDLIRALEAYQAAVSIVPDDATYWRLLAQFSAQYNVNVVDVGVPAAQRAVIIAKNDPADLDLLGWLLLIAGRYPEAERQLLQALELAPQSASIHFHLALLYLQLEQPDMARDYLIRARDLGSVEAQTALTEYFP